MLAISLETNSNILASALRDAKAEIAVTEITFHAIIFDRIVADAFLDLLTHNRRQWRNVEFINCRGDVENAISLALSTDAVQCLHLVRNIEPFDGYGILGRGLKTTNSLKKLRLTTTTIGETDAAFVSEGLAQNNSLDTIEFRWSTFLPGTVARLAQGFKKKRSLKSVDFFGCSLRDNDLAEIFSSVRDHPSLQNLLLNGNKFGERGSLEVAKMLACEGCPLSKLDLSFQRLEGERIHVGKLAESLGKNTSLRILDLTCDGLDDVDAAMLSNAMVQNRTIRELFLARNKFTDKGITTIAHKLPAMKGLKKLSLWGNRFGEKGARALLNGIANNMELCDLHLFRKFVCSDQIQYFENINRAGRKLLQEAPNQVPLSLWPRVLERANTMKVPPRQKAEEFQEARIDMLFCLLRGPVLFARDFDLALETGL